MKTQLLFFSFLILCFSCKKTERPNPPTPTAAISALNCGFATVSSAAIEGIPYSGSITVPYSGGNGLTFAAGSSIASSGITGLNATLVEGKLANGSDNFTFNVSERLLRMASLLLIYRLAGSRAKLC